MDSLLKCVLKIAIVIVLSWFISRAWAYNVYNPIWNGLEEYRRCLFLHPMNPNLSYNYNTINLKKIHEYYWKKNNITGLFGVQLG